MSTSFKRLTPWDEEPYEVYPNGKLITYSAADVLEDGYPYRIEEKLSYLLKAVIELTALLPADKQVILLNNVTDFRWEKNE